MPELPWLRTSPMQLRFFDGEGVGWDSATMAPAPYIRSRLQGASMRRKIKVGHSRRADRARAGARVFLNETLG